MPSGIIPSIDDNHNNGIETEEYNIQAPNNEVLQVARGGQPFLNLSAKSHFGEIYQEEVTEL